MKKSKILYDLELNEASKVLDNFPNFKLKQIISKELVKTGNKGHLSLIVGGMYSGKTTKLINLIKECKFFKLKFQCFKLDFDNRYDKTKIVSHDKDSVESEVISNSSKFQEKISNDTQIVFIDEVQFLDTGIIDQINSLIDKGKIVICTGLNADFKGEAFDVMRDLLPLADYIDRLQSICYKCSAPATMTQRLINDIPAYYHDPVILVGESDLYKPVCRSCHEIRF